MNKQVSVIFMVMSVLITVCLILSNLLAVKQFNFFGFAATAGMIIFPISYIINDCIIEVWGFKKAKFVIWMAFVINFFAILVLQISVATPPSPHWKMQEAYEVVLAQTPRIAIASLLAFLVGSFLNAYVMSKMKILHKGKKFGQRAIASTIVGELADTALFTLIAFLFVIPIDIIFQIILLETVFKILFEILFLPITVRVVKYVKKITQEDVYDTDVSYQLFKAGE